MKDIQQNFRNNLIEFSRTHDLTLDEIIHLLGKELSTLTEEQINIELDRLVYKTNNGLFYK